MHALTMVMCLAALAASDWAPEPNVEVLFEADFTDEDKWDDDWTWLREDPEDWRLADGALEIRSRPGDAETVRNALLRPVPDVEGPLVFEVTVTFTETPTGQWEQAGLTWYHDGEPDFKIVHELLDDEILIVPGFEPTEKDTVQLRLVVEDDGSYKAKFREEDEEEFQEVADGELPLGEDNAIALVTYHGPEDADHWMRFTDFRIFRP